MINLYTPEGWIDVPSLEEGALTFNVGYGARGIGKTFGFLADCLLDHPRKFLLLRRSQVQADLIASSEFSPFRAIDRKRGSLTALKRINRYLTGVYKGIQSDDGRLIAEGQPVGYLAALASIHNIRGYDMDVDEMILDEFCPEKGERQIRDEFDVYRNAYETINRNRELEGRPPIRAWLLSNSNMLANNYFIGLRIVETVDRMTRQRREIWRDEKRGLMIVNFCDSPISKRKAETALYQLSADDQFTGMALNNEFSHESRSRTGSLPLRELLPLVQIGELQIYRHKGSRQLYGSLHRSGSPDVYSTDDAGIARFCARYDWLWDEYMDDHILWQSYLPEVLFRRFFNAGY